MLSHRATEMSSATGSNDVVLNAILAKLEQLSTANAILQAKVCLCYSSTDV